MNSITERRIDDLAEKAARGQDMHIDAVLDWSTDLIAPRWIARKDFIGAVSQLLHGERATLAICRDLHLRLEGPARRFVAVQAVDEQRHVAIYERYLARAGDIAPARAGFDAALAEMQAWSGHPAGQLAAVHGLVEAAAVHLHADMDRWYACPLLRAVHVRVNVEEARHVAFGRQWLKDIVPGLPPDIRADIARWLRHLWLLATGHDRGGALGLVERTLVAARWRRHARDLRALGFAELG